MKSLNVPGNEVDSFITKQSFEMLEAIIREADLRNAKSVEYLAMLSTFSI
jgi:hypothetical protein